MSKLIFLLFFFVCYMIFQALKSAMSGSKQAYMAVNGPSENYFVPPDVHHAMLESARNSEQQGIDFANHCYEEYLKTGQYFILSDIDKIIKRDFEYQPVCVSNGFLSRMKDLIDNNLVANVCLEGDDVAFIHINYIDKYLST